MVEIIWACYLSIVLLWIILEMSGAWAECIAVNDLNFGYCKMVLSVVSRLQKRGTQSKLRPLFSLVGRGFGCCEWALGRRGVEQSRNY